MKIKILMFCKNNSFCSYAIKILESYFSKEEIIVYSGSLSSGGRGRWQDLDGIKPEYIISFLSPWIVPKAMLKTATKAAINFHPGSPNYPGTGCYNFAIYEGATQYGVTCHHMNEKIDAGCIIMTSYFEISKSETIESLKLKSMVHLTYCFNNILSIISKGEDLPISEEKWLRQAFTRKKLEALCYINPLTMSEDEIALRIKATDYGDAADGAFTNVCGVNFYYRSSKGKPIV